MFQQDLAPLGSLTLSALVALLPLATIFVLLGWLRVKAHWAALAALAVAIVVAVAAFGMPVGLALLSATEGAVFGLFPIMWIVFTAIWLYQLTVVSGRFDDLRTAFGYISDDPRCQAIIIAFCFGGLMEALAGFGAPVAITGVMLMALGFSPIRAAVVVLLANTAPVAFGAIGMPIITAGALTGIPYQEIGAYVGRQTPLLAVFVPLLLRPARRRHAEGCARRGPSRWSVGVTFAIAQFVASNFISVELTDIIASLAGSGRRRRASCAFWTARRAARRPPSGCGLTGPRRPRAPVRGTGTRPRSAAGPAGATRTVEQAPAAESTRLAGGRLFLAFFPYLLVIVVFCLAKLVAPLTKALAATDVEDQVAGARRPRPQHRRQARHVDDLQLPVVVRRPARSCSSAGSSWRWSTGSRRPRRRGEFVATAVKLRFAILTVASVLALAYVMNLSGQTITIGTWIAGTGAFFAFLSPILGWLGTAVTGSDTRANALFATLQQTAAQKAGIDPTLLVAANTSGGVVGKMISPQNLTIAATAVGVVGRESDLFRKVRPVEPRPAAGRCACWCTCSPPCWPGCCPDPVYRSETGLHRPRTNW